jgi:hypothetical protein
MWSAARTAPGHQTCNGKGNQQQNATMRHDGDTKANMANAR